MDNEEDCGSSARPENSVGRYASAGRLEGDSSLQIWTTASKGQLRGRARAFPRGGGDSSSKGPEGATGSRFQGTRRNPGGHPGGRAGAARVAPSESAWDGPGQGPVLRQSRGRFPGCKVFSAQPGSSSSQRPQEEGTVAMSRTRGQAQTGRLWKAQAHGLSPVCSRQWCRDQGGQVGGGKAGGLSLGV